MPSIRTLLQTTGLLAALLAPGLAVQARTVTVGLYQNPPKLMADDQGQPGGILGEVLQAIAREEGWTLQAVRCEWEACLAALNQGKLDLMPDVARTDARLAQFNFHQVPALHSWSQLYRRKDVVAESMLDLQGRRVAVLEGSSQQEYLRPLLSAFGLDTRFVTARNFDEAFALVRDGQADVVASNRHFGDVAAQRYGLEDTTLIFQPARLFYAAGKGRQPELLDAIDRHLAAWQADPGSPYFGILKRWAPQRDAGRVPARFWWSLGGVGAMLLLALAFVALLRREVARRTQALRTSEDKLTTILNGIDAYIYIKDVDLRYQYANRRVCELFGLPLSEVLGRGDDTFFDPPTSRQLEQIDRGVLEAGERRVSEEHNRTLGGQERTYISVKMPLRDTSGRTYALCGISTDITEQQHLAREIHQLAFHDPLTHLANRRQTLERLQGLLEAGEAALQQHALLLVNLDHFKELNERFGHQHSDQLLVQVARRIQACAHGGDLVARLGGDEFALLMTGLPPLSEQAQRQTEQRAQQVQQAITGLPFELDDTPVGLSACLGVVLLQQTAASVDTVLKQADLALQQAKAAGPGSVRFFRADMAMMAAARAALEADLREGLSQEQFLLFYQPQVDECGSVFGLEALVRWQHPVRGLLAPGAFIGLAEVSGLIEPLGLWILRTACAQLAAWRGDPKRQHLRIAVNISARQLHHPDFVAQVLSILAGTGAPPALLELELTESHLVEDLAGATAKMQSLQASGLRLALDDFGTGYSSLHYLKRLPLHQLKIDQSFVRDLLIDANDLSIVKAVIDMGHHLGLEVLAEGVEHPAQRDMLLQAGCRRFQGYLFGHPTPVDRLALD